jgi:hypothetical protein
VLQLPGDFIYYMKKMFILLTILFFSIFGFSQDLPRIEHDTLYSVSGYNLAEGMIVRLGTGANKTDGSFVYVQRNDKSGYIPANRIIPASWKDVRMHVYRVTKRGNKKDGYKYYALLLAHTGPYIQVDLDKAIKAGEIIVPGSIHETAESN